MILQEVLSVDIRVLTLKALMKRMKYSSVNCTPFCLKVYNKTVAYMSFFTPNMKSQKIRMKKNCV